MKAPKTERVLAPAGNHLARIMNIIYIGTVKGEYKGKPTESYKVRLTWELPTEKHVFREGEEEKPFAVSKEVTLSMGKKSALRPIVEGIIGTSLSDEEAYDFDVDSLLGMSCLLNLAHEETANGKYVAIKSATPIPKGMSCPPPVNTPKILSYAKWDENFFGVLPPFIKEKMEKTPEFAKMMGKNVPESGDDTDTISASDVPFD